MKICHETTKSNQTMGSKPEFNAKAQRRRDAKKTGKFNRNERKDTAWHAATTEFEQEQTGQTEEDRARRKKPVPFLSVFSVSSCDEIPVFFGVFGVFLGFNLSFKIFP